MAVTGGGWVSSNCGGVLCNRGGWLEGESVSLTSSIVEEHA